MIKTLQKVGIEGTYLNIINSPESGHNGNIPQNSTSIYDKNSPESGHRGNITQHI